MSRRVNESMTSYQDAGLSKPDVASTQAPVMKNIFFTCRQLSGGGWISTRPLNFEVQGQG